MITISIADQTLEYQGKTYSISSAKNGVGEVEGSYCTPTGQFRISEKIGDKLKSGAVLVAREPTSEIYSPALLAKHPDRDWILTRILWLEGAEAHNQNTKDRYIYIHGSPDEVSMGVPGSKGCIRIRNSDVIELFDHVQIGEDAVIMKP